MSLSFMCELKCKLYVVLRKYLLWIFGEITLNFNLQLHVFKWRQWVLCVVSCLFPVCRIPAFLLSCLSWPTETPYSLLMFPLLKHFLIFDSTVAYGNITPWQHLFTLSQLHASKRQNEPKIAVFNSVGVCLGGFSHQPQGERERERECLHAQNKNV